MNCNFKLSFENNLFKILISSNLITVNILNNTEISVIIQAVYSRNGWNRAGQWRGWTA